jgi:hypothetical protein
MKTFLSFLAYSILTLSLTANAYESPLRKVCNGTQPTPENKKLAEAINILNGPEFSTAAKRKSVKEKYFQALKNVIAATTFGEHLTECLDNAKDSRFKNEGAFIAAKSFDGPSAMFEYPLDSGSGKYVRTIEILAKEQPLSAISFVAHEMQHSCHASEDLSLDQNGADNSTRDQDALVDELRAYKLQADFFFELAQQSSLVCEKEASPSMLFPGRSFTMQDLLAEIDESIHAGTFYSNVVSAYVNNGMYQDESEFYKSSDEESGENKKSPKEDFIKRVEDAGFKISGN